MDDYNPNSEPSGGAAGDAQLVELQRGVVVRLITALFRQPDLPDQEKSLPVKVMVENLASQLQRGRVSTTIRNLLEDIPSHMLVPDYVNHLDKHVILPLDQVISQVDPALLNKGKSDQADVDGLDMPDVFQFTGHSAPTDAAITLDQPFSSPVSAPLDQAPATEEDLFSEEEDEEDAQVPELKLKGIDVNRSGAEELSRRLDGVGLTLARKIVENRKVFGPFLSVHELARVPGVGPRSFQTITGMRWREDANVQREMVMDILDVSPEGKVSVQDVAERFGALPGFEGCIMTSTDGDMLATSWKHESQEALGAFAPQFIKKLAPYIQSLGIGEIDLMTLFISERPFTLIQYESLVFVAVHMTNRFSRKQIRVAQQVVNMLGRLLFHR